MTTTAFDSYATQLSPAMSPSKRIFDFFAGLTLSLLTLPIMIVLALWSAIRLRAWPFFVQERIGLGGKPIRCVKIRTLSLRTPAYLDKDELIAHGGEQRWAAALRKTHLDEIPQFWQVVTGTFSLVGPRPMIASIVDRMSEDVADVRHSVRPGVTGPWQISVHGSTLLDETCDYDLAYVHHAAAWIDVRILMWTAAQALGMPGRSERYVFELLRVRPDESKHCSSDWDPVDDSPVIEKDVWRGGVRAS